MKITKSDADRLIAAKNTDSFLATFINIFGYGRGGYSDRILEKEVLRSLVESDLHEEFYQFRGYDMYGKILNNGARFKVSLENMSDILRARGVKEERIVHFRRDSSLPFFCGYIAGYHPEFLSTGEVVQLLLELHANGCADEAYQQAAAYFFNLYKKENEANA